MRLSKLVSKYLEHQYPYNKCRTAQSASYIVHRLLDFFEDREVSKLTDEDLRDYIKRRRTRVRDISVHHDLTILRGMLRFGILRGDIEKMPLEIQMLRVNEKRELPVLTKEEIGRLLRNARDRYCGIILIAATTGMRGDEILHLARADVRWQEQRMTVTAKGTWSPKSHQSRSTYVPESLLSRLAGYRAPHDRRRDEESQSAA